MKKILNRVAAAAIAVPMVLTQGAMMNISAEDAGVKALGIDTFTAIPADKIESEWNTKVLNVVASMEGTQKEISKEEFVALIPESTPYYETIMCIVGFMSTPVLTVNDGVMTVKSDADMTDYAEDKIYSKVREALVNEGYTDAVEMTAFNKAIEVVVSVDSSALKSGKQVKVDYTITADGTDITKNISAYFAGLANDLVDSIIAQIGDEYADTVNESAAKTMTMIDKIERAEKWMNKAATFERTGSYATADEMLAAISKFVAGKTSVYKVPASVDEAVARHGEGFDKAVKLISDITVSSGYSIDVTASDIAELAKSGSKFEAAASAGTYTVTFQIPDAEAAEVEAYVNKNAEEGKAYDYSYKVVEAKGSVTGDAYLDIKRVIVMKDVEVTTSTTTATTTTTTESDDTTTTTTTTVTTGSGDTTSTTTNTTGSGDTTTTTTNTTGSGETTTTTDPIPEGFIIEKVEVKAGKNYYFSHDENAFNLDDLIESLTLVGILDDAPYTVQISHDSFGKYLKPEYATPAEYFNAVENTAYVASTLGLTFTPNASMKVAEGADLTITDLPTVYIGVKGDTDLNGVVELSDATLTLDYYAKSVAMLPVSFNEDPDLNTLAYFLSDVDTESKAGADTETTEISLSDASNILAYYAKGVAMLDPKWDEILGK